MDLKRGSRIAALALGVTTGGCNLVFDIAPVTDAAPAVDAPSLDGDAGGDPVVDAELDGPPDEVTVDWRYQRLVGGSPTGAPVLANVDPLEDVQVFLGPDAIEPSDTVATGSMITFPRPHTGARYRIVRTVAGSVPIEQLQLDAAIAKYTQRDIGRADMTPSQSTTVLTFKGTPITAPGSVWLYTVGGFSATNLSTLGAGGTPTAGQDPNSIRWTAVVPVPHGNPVGLLDPGLGDAFAYLYYTTQTNAGHEYSVVSKLVVDSIEMGGTGTMYSYTLASPVRAFCQHVNPSRRQEEDRLDAIDDEQIDITHDMVHSSWAISEVAAGSDEALAPLRVVNNGGAYTDDDVTVSYPNVLPGTRVDAELRVSYDRPYQLDGLAVATLPVGTDTFRPITRNLCSMMPTALVISGRTEIPTRLTINGTPIVHDGDPVVIAPPQMLHAAWDRTSAADLADLYRVELYELTPVNGMTTLVLKTRYVTDVRAIDIDPTALEDGAQYAISIEAVEGYPNHAVHDFATFSQSSGVAEVPMPAFKLSKN